MKYIHKPVAAGKKHISAKQFNTLGSVVEKIKQYKFLKKDFDVVISGDGVLEVSSHVAGTGIVETETDSVIIDHYEPDAVIYDTDEAIVEVLINSETNEPTGKIKLHPTPKGGQKYMVLQKFSDHNHSIVWDYVRAHN